MGSLVITATGLDRLTRAEQQQTQQPPSQVGRARPQPDCQLPFPHAVWRRKDTPPIAAFARYSMRNGRQRTTRSTGSSKDFAPPRGQSLQVSGRLVSPSAADMAPRSSPARQRTSSRTDAQAQSSISPSLRIA